MGKITQSGINQGDLVKALQQTITALRTGTLSLPPHTWLNEGAGTPAQLAIFSDGASPVPGFSADPLAEEALGVRWNNHATPTPIVTAFTLPQDLDPTQDITANILAVRSATDASDLVTFTLTTYPNLVGSAAAAAAEFVDTSTAMGDDVNIQKLTATIAAASVPAAGSQLTVSLQPTDGLLDTIDVTVIGVYLEYSRLIPTADADKITISVT